MKIVILTQAEKDLIDGFHFYERQASGLGGYFRDSVMSDIDSLRLYAGIHSLQHGKHRMLCKRFPFNVYYTLENDVARVVAVLHQRRDPAWIQRRVEGRD